MNRLNYFLILLSPILLIACIKTPSNACGVLFTYTPAFDKTVEKQYPKLPDEAKKMIDDYGKTRDTIRACQKND